MRARSYSDTAYIGSTSRIVDPCSSWSTEIAAPSVRARSSSTSIERRRRSLGASSRMVTASLCCSSGSMRTENVCGGPRRIAPSSASRTIRSIHGRRDTRSKNAPNAARSRAIGLSPYPYRLAAFIIAGAMCGVAGALYANHTSYITPGLMAWHQSGEMMFMVILGGMASTAGPVLGTFALLLIEEVLKGWTEHWQVILGPLLVLSVVFFRRGLAGIFFKPDA